MELPKITTPIFDVIIPSTNKTIRVRPFLVKEEKLLLMAAASNDPNDIIATTKQVINNCLIDKGTNVDTLPFFDIDYLFIALRAKSVGETIDINFKCNNLVEGTPCGNIFPVALDISKATIVRNEALESKIHISDKVGAMLKYPSYAAMKSLENEDPLTKETKLIAKSIDYLYDADKVYPSKDMSPGELEAFIDGLTKSQLEPLELWVNNFPAFEIRKTQVCTKCGFDHTIQYRDFASFF